MFRCYKSPWLWIWMFFCPFSPHRLHVPHHLWPVQVSVFFNMSAFSLIRFVPKLLHTYIFEQGERERSFFIVKQTCEMLDDTAVPRFANLMENFLLMKNLFWYYEYKLNYRRGELYLTSLLFLFSLSSHLDLTDSLFLYLFSCHSLIYNPLSSLCSLITCLISSWVTMKKPSQVYSFGWVPPNYLLVIPCVSILSGDQ